MTPGLHMSYQITKQKVVAMETQYKLAARSAQLLAKDAPQDEAARVMATMATAKSQLSKVGIIYIWKVAWNLQYLKSFFESNTFTLNLCNFPCHW